MADYVKIFSTEKYVEVCLYADSERLLALSEKMQSANPDAYMNGYNWEAFWAY